MGGGELRGGQTHLLFWNFMANTMAPRPKVTLPPMTAKAVAGLNLFLSVEDYTAELGGGGLEAARSCARGLTSERTSNQGDVIGYVLESAADGGDV